MNRVGEKGKGESVWLGWFLVKTLTDFMPFAKAAGDKPRADAWQKHAKTLKKALEAAGWDGEWYRRGSYDDGTPLGSRSSDECQHRRDRAVVERAVRPGRPGAGADGDAFGATDAGRRRAADHQAVHAAVRQDREGSGLHQELSAGRPRKRRPVHACGDVVRHRAGRARAGRRGLALHSACSTRSTMRSTPRPPNATASNPMWWLPTSIRSARSPAAAAGPGTRARPAGSIARRSRRSSASASRATAFVVNPVIPGEWNGFSATLRLGGAATGSRSARSGARAPAMEIDGKPTERGRSSFRRRRRDQDHGQDRRQRRAARTWQPERDGRGRPIAMPPAAVADASAWRRSMFGPMAPRRLAARCHNRRPVCGTLPQI